MPQFTIVVHGDTTAWCSISRIVSEVHILPCGGSVVLGSISGGAWVAFHY